MFTDSTGNKPDRVRITAGEGVRRRYPEPEAPPPAGSPPGRTSARPRRPSGLEAARKKKQTSDTKFESSVTRLTSGDKRRAHLGETRPLFGDLLLSSPCNKNINRHQCMAFNFDLFRLPYRLLYIWGMVWEEQ